MTEPQLIKQSKESLVGIQDELIFPTSSPRRIQLQNKLIHKIAMSPRNSINEEQKEDLIVQQTLKLLKCIKWVEVESGVDQYNQISNDKTYKQKTQTQSVCPSLIQKRNRTQTVKSLPLRKTWSEHTKFSNLQEKSFNCKNQQIVSSNSQNEKNEDRQEIFQQETQENYIEQE